MTDATVPLLIAEGEKKGAAADQHGFACIVLGGVWSWQVKRKKNEQGKGQGPRQMIPDLRAVPWQSRRVVITFDSDINEKSDVQWAEWHLAEALREVGADVRVIRLPGAENGEKVIFQGTIVASGVGFRVGDFLRKSRSVSQKLTIDTRRVSTNQNRGTE